MEKLRILLAGLFLINSLSFGEEAQQPAAVEFPLASIQRDAFADIPPEMKGKITAALEAEKNTHAVELKYTGIFSIEADKAILDAVTQEKNAKDAIQEALGAYKTIAGLLELEELLGKSSEMTNQKITDLHTYKESPEISENGPELIRNAENEQTLITEMLKRIRQIKATLRGESTDGSTLSEEDLAELQIEIEPAPVKPDVEEPHQGE